MWFLDSWGAGRMFVLLLHQASSKADGHKLHADGWDRKLVNCFYPDATVATTSQNPSGSVIL